jgi:hypothetical protein
MRVSWLWAYFIQGLQLLSIVAVPLLYESVNIAYLDDPSTFIKNLAIRLGWFVGQMEEYETVLSKRPCQLHESRRLPVASLLIYKPENQYLSYVLLLCFCDTTQRGYLQHTRLRGETFVYVNGLQVNEQTFHQRLLKLVRAIKKPGDFPRDSDADSVDSLDSDADSSDSE